MPEAWHFEPFEYRGYRIEPASYAPPIPTWRQYMVVYTHTNYDGAEDGNDHRHGQVATVSAAKVEIDEMEDN